MSRKISLLVRNFQIWVLFIIWLLILIVCLHILLQDRYILNNCWVEQSLLHIKLSIKLTSKVEQNIKINRCLIQFVIKTIKWIIELILKGPFEDKKLRLVKIGYDNILKDRNCLDINEFCPVKLLTLLFINFPSYFKPV